MIDFLLPALAAAGIAFAVYRTAARRNAHALRRVRDSEERFRALTALSADWFWESDAQLRVTWIGGGGGVGGLLGDVPAFGAKLWELPGITAERDALAQCVARVRDQLAFQELELTRVNAGGALVHSISGVPRFGDDGTLLGYRGVGHDLTARRAAERALAKSEQRLQLATGAAALAVWDCDVRSDGIWLSRRWFELLGRVSDAETLRSVDLLALIHPDDRDGVRGAFLRAVKGDSPVYAVEYRLRTDSGGWRWISSSGKVVERDAAGRAVRLSGTAMDIDPRRRAEQALHDAEARYRALVSATPSGVLVCSSGIIEYANPAAVRMLRYRTGHELVGRRLIELADASDRAPLADRLQFHEQGPGGSEPALVRFSTDDGVCVPLETSAVSFLQEGRLVVQVVLTEAFVSRGGALQVRGIGV